jgi:hypothetical protein
MTRTPLARPGLARPGLARPGLALSALALLALAACMQRPPNNTTAEGQAFYACDRTALDQTADMPNLIPQVMERESVRRECLASNNIPPLPGAKYIEAPVAQSPLPAAPAAQPAPAPAPSPPTPPTPVVPDSQNYQPPPIIQPPPS